MVSVPSRLMNHLSVRGWCQCCISHHGTARSVLSSLPDACLPLPGWPEIYGVWEFMKLKLLDLATRTRHGLVNLVTSWFQLLDFVVS